MRSIFVHNGEAIRVDTSDMDFGGERTAEVHVAKYQSLRDYTREHGTATGWTYGTDRADGKRVVWTYVGCGEIVRDVRTPIIDEDGTYVIGELHKETSEITVWSEVTDRASVNKRDYLRRKMAKAHGFTSWKDFAKSDKCENEARHAVVTAQILASGTPDDAYDESPDLPAWESLTHPMDRPAQRAIHPGKVYQARAYVSGHNQS